MKRTLVILGIIASIGIMIFKLFGNGKNENNYDKQYASMVDEIRKYTWEDFEAVKTLIQPAVEVITQSSNKVNIGQSKLGGTPHLPNNFDWPKYDGKSMVFIGQLNLEELKDYHRNEFLPHKGILYFFSFFPKPVNEFGAEYEFLPSKDRYKTLYYDGNVSELINREFPEDLTKDYHFETQKIRFRTFFHMPPSLETSVMENSDLSDNDKNTIEEYNESFSDDVIDQVLGVPVPIQYGADYDLAMAYLNISYEDEKTQQEKIEKERPHFINLLTIPMFDRIGDSQCYFGIHKEDLIKRDFDKIVFIMQGT